MPSTSKIWEKIEKFAEDIATLEVVTLSGDIRLSNQAPAAAAPATAAPATLPVAGTVPAVTTSNNVTNSGLGDIFKLVSSHIDLSKADIDVVAYTRSELDHDTLMFVKTGANQGLIDAHNATVLAAHKARYEALGVLAKAIGAKL